MTDFVDPNELMAWFVAASEWTVENVFNRWVLIQLVIIAVLYGVAWLLARRIRPWMTSRLDKLQVSPRFARLAQSAPRMLRPVAFAILLWTVVAVMRQVTWPSYSYLLAVASNLLTAWIVISFASTFIRNEAISRIFALATWSIAALNMTDLLAPTVAILDSAAMNFGELRISVLTILQALLSLAVLLWAALALSRALETRINRVPDLTPSVQVLLGKLIKITLLAFAVVIALNTVGIDLTALALFSGAIGVGIGFGLQKVVSNLISGVILLLDKSIKPGDVIELEDTFGWITSLGARYVSVNTRDGKEYLIPNEDLITHRVVNWSFSNQLVRLEIPIGVSYDSDPHEVRRIVREAAVQPARVDETTAPVCHLTGFGDSSLDFLLRFWIRDPQNGVVNIKGEVLLAVWDALKANGIEIPYPHRHLVLREPIQMEGVRTAAE